MRFCQPHWDTMRAAVDERGMAALVPEGGARAAEEVLARLLEGEESLDVFDPLMWMHMAIWSRAMSVLAGVGSDPMLLMVDWSTVPEVASDDAFTEAAACPLCVLDLLAWEHDARCTDEACQKEPGPIVGDWIPSCADAALERYQQLLAAS